MDWCHPSISRLQVIEIKRKGTFSSEIVIGAAITQHV